MYGEEEYRILNLIKKYKGGGGGGTTSLKTVTLTMEEYDDLVSDGTVDPDTFYMIVDKDGE